jgi:hypothetical protein
MGGAKRCEAGTVEGMKCGQGGLAFQAMLLAIHV